MFSSQFGDAFFILPEALKAAENGQATCWIFSIRYVYILIIIYVYACENFCNFCLYKMIPPF
jgi:2-iminoacetate synthase ThiH